MGALHRSRPDCAQSWPDPILNRLSWWCGCTEYHAHRSSLACFEDEHGAQCDVCMRTAEIAWDVAQHGVSDSAAIQQGLDAKVRPRLV